MPKLSSEKEATAAYIFRTLYRKGKYSWVSTHKDTLCNILVNEQKKTSEMKMATNQKQRSHNILTKEKSKMDSKINNKKYNWGWRDGSVGKSTDCSSIGHEFKSQHPHGGSQPSVKDI